MFKKKLLLEPSDDLEAKTSTDQNGNSDSVASNFLLELDKNEENMKYSQNFNEQKIKALNSIRARTISFFDENTSYNYGLKSLRNSALNFNEKLKENKSMLERQCSLKLSAVNITNYL